MGDVLEGLDDSQRSCVIQPPGPLAIEAGPGTGKTRVLTARVAYRAKVRTGDPRRTLAVTFTRSAASELRQRLAGLQVVGTQAGTLHAVAYQLLERHWADTGRARRRVVANPSRLLRRALAGLAEVSVESVAAEMEWAAARGLAPEEIPAAAAGSGRSLSLEPQLLVEAGLRYQRLKRARGVLDFGDLLVEARKALEDPALAAATRWRFAQVLVDEAQDLNAAQWHLLMAIMGSGDDLCVIGDPDQAIYGWNGADCRFLRDFEATFPRAVRLRLRHNYRCPPEVSAAAQVILGRRRGQERQAAGPAITVACAQSAKAEAAMVARAVRQAMAEGVGLSQIAVLARTNQVLEGVAGALRQEGVPCRGGRGLLDDPAVKEALHRLEASPDLPATGAVSELRAIADELGEEAAERGLGADELAEHQARLRQLVGVVAEWAEDQPRARSAALADWLTVALRSRGSEPHTAFPVVQLATFHRAKGLQWRRVFVVGLEEGLAPLPAPADPDEERRLVYVALTRTEEAVWCTWASSREAGRGPAARRPSPYLEEMGLLSTAVDQPLGTDSVGPRFEALRTQVLAARSAPRHRSVAVPAVGGAHRSPLAG